MQNKFISDEERYQKGPIICDTAIRSNPRHISGYTLKSVSDERI